ncbi:hypothetical protein HMPREF0201_00793 [Cedecea davisae DSM 4568]|uniref:Uncharacterized protein n=1 Tax=Cedecea davisae DSM 4568 TaxID=566551 RepID=S3J2U4_9ENTR|nr:hypothetical protein HMPREF0201_00793 [Cedecea davisae DSM 4568]
MCVIANKGDIKTIQSANNRGCIFFAYQKKNNGILFAKKPAIRRTIISGNYSPCSTH